MYVCVSYKPFLATFWQTFALI